MNDKSVGTDSPANVSSFEPHWGWAAAIAVLVVITVAVRYALPIRDGDIWFHLLYGEYFWQNKTLIPDHAIFSWTPATNEVIYCTWLSDIFFYLYYKVTSLTGLFVLRYFCIYMLVFSCYLFARRLKIASHPVSWFICLLAALMSYSAIIAKPEIFSFLFMTLMAWNWWHIRGTGDRAWLNCYLIPLIMLVWVNSHGGFVFGVVFLICIGVGELVNTWLSPENVLSPAIRKHLLIALILSSLTVFMTPYGYHYILWLWQNILPSKENLVRVGNVAAYLSPFRTEDFDSMKFIMLANISIVTLLCLFVRNFRNIEWSSLFANLVFVYLYTRFFRTTFYWSPVFLFSTLTLLGNKQLVPVKWKRWILTLALPSLMFGLAFLISFVVIRQTMLRPEMGAWMGFGIGGMNPVVEAKYIKKHFPTAKIGNTFDDGSYLLWELWPQNKVFIDARGFPYREWDKEYWKVFHSNIGYEYPARVEKFIEKYSCDLWCVGYNSSAVTQWLFHSPDWQLAFYGKNAVVFVRKGIPLPDGEERFSPSINTVKNLRELENIFYWALVIKDWKAVEVLQVRLSEYFTHPAQLAVWSRWAILAQRLKQEGKDLILSAPDVK